MPFYASVDLRNAGFKLAPVDTNLFPGGFNNLNPSFLPLCVQAVQAAVERVCPDARGVLLVPENHTRNTFYLQNVATLEGILRQAGMRVRIGSLNPEITTRRRKLDLGDGSSLTLEPVLRNGRRVGLDDFDPCMVLLNNDLSAGPPRDPRQASTSRSRRRWPPAGTTARSRTTSRPTARVAEEFAALARHRPLAHRSLLRRVRRDRLPGARRARSASRRTSRPCSRGSRRKYAEYGIDDKPFVDRQGRRGHLRHGHHDRARPSEVVRGLNRKQRNKMAVVKEGLEVTSVIIQEGVPTFESIDDAIAEPVVYMIDRFVVGGFYRVHTARGKDENLNAPGRAVRAARVRVAVHSRSERARRLRAQPLLRVRRRRAPRAARGGDRDRGARGKVPCAETAERLTLTFFFRARGCAAS